jgi:hypothetical protein
MLNMQKLVIEIRWQLNHINILKWVKMPTFFIQIIGNQSKLFITTINGMIFLIIKIDILISIPFTYSEY